MSAGMSAADVAIQKKSWVRNYNTFNYNNLIEEMEK